ncbi:hypothetical protein EJV47_09975 [Hymenobacter gummosus]|uniref:Uncharacterized protein n=1 Tax=Hymenobacter gummosus TaxID=1776032 RepID=A0A3S0QJ50_9BACT|nr:hypothetical protein [Hymenobacter gummosus]RTQ50931.1 hypothetical protein EJV47_09975 [Hymenobacter gummosus]
MKTYWLLAPLALLSSCDLVTCEKPPQPTCNADTAGIVLGKTCMAGTLVQLTNSTAGQTVRLNLDGAGLKTYEHVVSTHTELGPFAAAGTNIYFNLVQGGRRPAVQCEAYDAPADMPLYTLCNVTPTPCERAPTAGNN